VIGRGGARSEDSAPRLELGRQRPGGLAAGGALESGGVSRIQLAVEPREDGIAVEQLARRPLKVAGDVVERAVVPFGATFEIDDQLLFYVTRRSVGGPAAADTSAPFGEADRHGLVGESPAAWALRASVEFAARAPAHVLVHGPSGTGKELVARAIHAASTRGGRAMVARNAATLPDGLIDAELFGNVKGYPNPGMAERNGLVGEADGSSLFLDEIGELPAGLQAHLLRLLDRDGEYQRLGDSRVRRADLRVIAATNRDPASLKHDLAARLVVRVEVPGLEARREDVPLLLRAILGTIARHEPGLVERFRLSGDASRVPRFRVAAALVDALVKHAYTTHVRELERIVWTAVAESKGDLVMLGPATLAALAPPAAGADPTAAASEDREETVDPGADAIRAALAEGKNSVTAAARTLGLRNRYVLYRLLKKHDIDI
jgi:transcriptional regulator with GAF, ATPase, and Fis domain